MSDLSPFASAFEQAALEGSGSREASPASRCPSRQRIVGFREAEAAGASASASCADLPNACSLMERSGSVGGLSSQLIRAASAQVLAPCKPLTIQTSKSLRGPVLKLKRVPLIREHEAELGGSRAGSTADLGTTAASAGGPPAGVSMHRVHSSVIDMPIRRVRRALRRRAGWRARHPCRSATNLQGRWAGAVAAVRCRVRPWSLPQALIAPARLAAALPQAIQGSDRPRSPPRVARDGCPRSRHGP